MDLGDSSHFLSTQVSVEADCDRGTRVLDTQSPLSTTCAAGRRPGRAGGRACATRSLSGPSQSHSSLPHKLRGPNWTEAELLVLILREKTY